MEHTTEASPPTPDTPASPAKRSKKGLLILLLGGLIIVAGGLGAGMYGGKKFFAPKPTPDDIGKSKDEAPPPPPPPIRSTAADMSRLDELIEEGRYAEALDVCRSLRDEKEAVDGWVNYRTGLCLEGLDRHAEAMVAYRAGISARSSEHLYLASQLGVARTALQRGLLEEGRTLLCALLTRQTQPAVASRPFATDALLLLALSLADEFQPREQPTATNGAILARSLPGANPEHYVGWDIPPRGPRGKTSSTWKPTGTLKMIKAGVNPGEYKIEASLATESIVTLLPRIADIADLKIAFGPSAREALLGRETELACAGVKLADLLVWLTLPHGLTFQIEKGTLRVIPGAKLPAPVLRTYRHTLAAQMLRESLARATEHPFDGNLYVAMGNLDVSTGKFTDAANWYQRLGRERPRSSAGIAGMYNLGLVRVKLDTPLAGREAFYRAIDRAPGHEMTALCYWWIGRTHLDEGDLAGAQRAFLRALQVVPLAPAKPTNKKTTGAIASAVGLSCAHLLEGDPRSAWNALAQVRPFLQDLPYADCAVLLDGIARYQLAKDDSKRQATILAEFLEVLLNPRDHAWLGPIFPLLRGQFLGQIGLTEEMIALYQCQPTKGFGPFIEQMQYELGAALARTGQDSLARKKFEEFTATYGKEKGPWMVKVNTHLAALDLRANQPDACLLRCRELLKEKHADRPIVLGLMSQAYTNKKDYTRAATCLSGEVPEP